MTTLKLGFMGFGEASFHMASGLVNEGLKDILVYDKCLEMDNTVAIKNLHNRIAQSGVTLAHSVEHMVQHCNYIVVAVPAIFSEEACQNIIATAHNQNISLCLVDVCSSSPTVKYAISQQCKMANIVYVDSPMLGPLPVYGHKVPIVASGAGADDWCNIMTPWNMKITPIPGEAGKASRIKLSRSIFTKGLEALLVETFQFARKNGVEDVVMDSISSTMNDKDFQYTAQRYITSDLIHAKRRAHELAEAIAIMQECGITSFVADGAYKRLQHSADLNAGEILDHKTPESLNEVYDVWQKTGAM